MKSYKVFVCNGLKGNSVYKYIFTGGDVPKEAVIKNIGKLLADAKNDFPEAEYVDVMIPVAPKIPESRLKEIGQEVASGWGGSCTGVKCYCNSVEFKCIEHGEVFTTNLSYDYIKENYSSFLK